MTTESKPTSRWALTPTQARVVAGAVALALAEATASSTWGVPLGIPTALAVGGCGTAFCWSQRPAARVRREVGTRGWMGGLQWFGQASAWAMMRHHCTQGEAIRRLLGVDGTPRQPGRGRVARRATYVGRAVSVQPLLRARHVYTPLTRGKLVVGPAGGGKTSWVVRPIMDAPGPAYVSTTKAELFTMTGSERAQHGRVYVFNPAGLGNVASTFGWDPVSGCADPAIADARARALVRGGGGAASGQQAEFWSAKAAEIVRCYLLAAALIGAPMKTVMGWALRAGDRTEVLRILESEPDRVPEGWIGTWERNLDAAPGERSGYLAAVIPAVTFVDNPLVAAACTPAPDQALDIEEFLRAGASTIYVIAGDDKRIAPLITALTEAVFDAAKREAAHQPGGRLDPPLSLFLDEVANTTPVPLDNWAADSRGWGIDLTAIVQDLAQLESRWGASKARTIEANLPVKIVLPGVTAKSDLEALAFLAGTRTVRRTTETESSGRSGGKANRSRQRSWVEESVVTGAQIYALPAFHAYVLGLGPRPVVVRFEPGYKVAAKRAKQRRRRETATWTMVPARQGGQNAVVIPIRPHLVPQPDILTDENNPRKLSS